MKQQDTVFLLTLIDFLFQVIFFGLFLYAIYAVKNDPKINKPIEDVIEKYKTSAEGLADSLPSSFDNLKKLVPDQADKTKEEAVIHEMNRQGVSNIVELTDELSRLAPVKDLAALDKATKAIGGEKEIAELNTLITKAGGYQQTTKVLEKYIASGVGKPHCAPITDSTGKVIGAKSLATVIAYDDRLEFQEETPQLSAFLTQMGLSYSQITSLSPSEFSQTFKKARTKFPDCIHMLNLKEVTKFVYARDAASIAFRLKISRQ